MPGADGFYPPVQYSPLWLVLGIVLIMLVVAWIVFVLVSTRRRREQVVADPLAGMALPTPALRETYLGLIDQVATAYAAGVLDLRESHQRLGLLVREFAAQARGIRAQYMTLEDLRATPLAPLSATVGELYPGSFSGTDTGSVDVAVARARTLVSEWR